MIDVQDLVVGYRGRPVARVASLCLVASRVTVVVGPNGSGKTTLLKTLAGLLPAISGRIAPLPRRGPGGAVFVHSAAFLFAGTVRKNLLAASPGREQDARSALSALGVEHLWNQDADQLSSGQRQRVAIARALAVAPRLLLVDEPEGGLDAEAVADWRRVMERAIREGQPAIVMAAHRPVGIEKLPVEVLPLGEALSSERGDA